MIIISFLFIISSDGTNKSKSTHFVVVPIGAYKHGVFHTPRDARLTNMRYCAVET